MPFLRISLRKCCSGKENNLGAACYSELDSRRRQIIARERWILYESRVSAKLLGSQRGKFMDVRSGPFAKVAAEDDEIRRYLAQDRAHDEVKPHSPIDRFLIATCSPRANR
jgi:hypothetical protein